MPIFDLVILWSASRLALMAVWYSMTMQGAQWRLFERTGMLNQPPQILLTALSKLRAKHLAEGCQFPQFLSDMAIKLGPRASKFTYPDKKIESTKQAMIILRNQKHVNAVIV
jgi:hypothetical protein